MKKIAILSLMTLAISAHASLPSEITALLNKTGTLSSIYNGKAVRDEDGNTCEIKKSPYDENTITIEAGLYFTPNANLDGAKREIKNNQVIYTTTYSGKRPGGSECGDYSKMTGFKEQVIVKENSIAIVKTFRCNLIEKVEMIEECKIQK